MLKFDELRKQFDHIPWIMFANADESGCLTVLGTFPGTHFGQMVLLSGCLSNNLDQNEEVWLHVVTYEGEGILTLTTGRHIQVKPFTSVAMPVRLFASLVSPAWYGYIFTEVVR